MPNDPRIAPQAESWQPMAIAPHDATEVEVLTHDGTTLVAHWACDLSGEDQPAFRGWFRAVNDSLGRFSHYGQILTPKAWRPLGVPHVNKAEVVREET